MLVDTMILRTPGLGAWKIFACARAHTHTHTHNLSVTSDWQGRPGILWNTKTKVRVPQELRASRNGGTETDLQISRELGVHGKYHGRWNRALSILQLCHALGEHHARCFNILLTRHEHQNVPLAVREMDSHH